MISQNTHLSQKNQHKHRKLLWTLLILVSIFIILPIIIAAWLGFVPGLSNLFGSRDARDLGVRYSEDDLANYEKKASIEFKNYALAPIDSSNSSQKEVFSSPETVEKLPISQEEATAAINSVQWSWFPVKEVQVRMGQDTLEVSGYINSENLNNFADYLADNGNESDNIKNAVDWANRFAKDMPFYVKANTKIIDNKLSFKLLEAEIGRLDVPLGSLGPDLSDGTSINIHSADLDIASAKISDKKIIISGTYPSVIYIKQ